MDDVISDYNEEVVITPGAHCSLDNDLEVEFTDTADDLTPVMEGLVREPSDYVKVLDSVNWSVVLLEFLP